MCGIFGFFGLPIEEIEIPVMTDKLFGELGVIAQERGKDGFGYMVNGRVKTEPYKNLGFPDYPMYSNDTQYGLLNCRAKPETEAETDDQNIQPIVRSDYCVVHNGSLSEEYVTGMYKKYNYKPKTKIDSEALLCMLMQEGLSKESLSKIDGGFAFMATQRNSLGLKFYVACKYQPLYQFKVDICLISSKKSTTYYYFHSCEKAMDSLEEYFSTFKKESKNAYIITTKTQYPEYSFSEFLMTDNSIKSKHGTFPPLFTYPTRLKTRGGIKVLCAASGGIDSTTSLLLADRLLKDAKVNFSIDAVHFMYGHRGEEAEEFAIRNIVDYSNRKKGTNFNLKVIKLTEIFRDFFNVKNSQLINTKVDVETGTKEKLKSTIAWVPVRNMLFQTLLIGLAETYILEEGYEKVYLVAGWNQLSEEGFYPDNSSRFSHAMLRAAKFGTLAGERIHTWNICSNLLKSDQWLLANMYGFMDVFKRTISCDIPIVKREPNGTIKNVYNCDGQCGSTLLSIWAAKRYIDIIDPRTFKEAVTNVKKETLYQIPKQEPVKITEDIILDALKRIIKIPEIS